MIDKDNRSAERYHVRWKIALIFDELEHKPTYHGKTHDLSLTGTGMLTHDNIFSPSPVVILLALPPLYRNQLEKVIEIRAHQVYTVYSGETSCFRLGFEFVSFKDDGLQVLKERLKHHHPKLKTAANR